jgi:hypothetical protein
MLAVVLALTAAIGYGGSDFAAGLASRSAPAGLGLAGVGVSLIAVGGAG